MCSYIYICLLLVDTDGFDSCRPAKGPSSAWKNVSVDDHGWSLPIKVESQAAYSSPQSHSYSLDSPRSHESLKSQPQNIFPPPGNFASGHSKLPREIPVVFEGINESLRSLRQIPVEIEQGKGNELARSVSIERSPIQRALLRGFASTEVNGKQRQLSPPPQTSQRAIPIHKDRNQTVSHTSIENESRLDSPRNIRIERDEKRADIEKRRIDLERDINNVIYDAINQVPIYDKQTKQEIKPPPFHKYPDIDPPAYGAQQSEYIIPKKVESQREKRVEEAIKHQLETEKKETLQKQWEVDQAKEQTHDSGSYVTLPVKKKVPSYEMSKQPFETGVGSYSTLPFSMHKNKRSGSPPFQQQRNIIHDDVYFSDIEGGRGKAQPSWRPMHSPLQSKLVWKPKSYPANAPEPAWAPIPSQEKQGKTLNVSCDTVPVSERKTQQGRCFIPIQIQHEERPNEGIRHGFA